MRTHALIGLLVAGSACAGADDAQQATDDLGSAPLASAAVAQVNTAKSLIHVWKSPT